MPLSIASSFTGNKLWWRSGSGLRKAFITLSVETMGGTFKKPPYTNMLKHFIIDISAAVSIAAMCHEVMSVREGRSIMPKLS